MESGAFLDAADQGQLTMYLLGWGADYPDQTNFLDYHFGEGASPQFGKGFEDIWAVLKKAASLSDQAERNKLYAEANNLIKQHVPMVPVAHGGSATALQGRRHRRARQPAGQRELLGDGSGRSRHARLDAERRADRPLLRRRDRRRIAARVRADQRSRCWPTRSAAPRSKPSLAESYEANGDLTEWTFKLRPGVKFHDGTDLDAKDVILSYAVQWDAAHPLHKGRDGSFTYFPGLFGQFLNAPPAE